MRHCHLWLWFFSPKNTLFSLITTQKMKFFIKDFFSKCDQIRSLLRIWSHLRKKSLMENFIFCAVDRISKMSKGAHDQRWRMYLMLARRNIIAVRLSTDLVGITFLKDEIRLKELALFLLMVCHVSPHYIEKVRFCQMHKFCYKI